MLIRDVIVRDDFSSIISHDALRRSSLIISVTNSMYVYTLVIIIDEGSMLYNRGSVLCLKPICTC
jgi:hypothetical protein